MDTHKHNYRQQLMKCPSSSLKDSLASVLQEGVVGGNKQESNVEGEREGVKTEESRREMHKVLYKRKKLNLLYCIVLHCIVLYCIVLYCIVLMCSYFVVH
jgi:hypothetical protein